MTKPDIPKRLASRIRGAQRAVDNARYDIWNDANGLAQSLARIEEFENDPKGFADRYYGLRGVHTRPVETDISREREWVARRRAREVAQGETLKAADGRLIGVEAEVLVEVTAMRPSPGRVPWPKPLKSCDRAFVEYGRQREREDAQDAKEDERQRLEDERIEAAENVAEALAEALEDIEWFGEAAGLTRAERQELKREARAHAKEGTIVNVRFER